MNRGLLLALGLIFLFHLSAGLYLVYQRPALFFQNDAEEYYELGKNLGERGEFVIEKQRYYEPRRSKIIPEAYRTQIFSVAHGALVFCRIPAPAAAALLLALISVVSGWLMYAIAHRLTGGSVSASYLALILYQLHPLLGLYSVQFGSEAMFTAGLLWFYYSLISHRGWKQIILAAVAGAVTTLVRPTALVFLPAGVCLIFFLARSFHYRIWLKAGVYAALFFLILAPAGIRSLIQSGSFSLTGYLGGYNLYVGNNRHNLAAYTADNGHDFLHHQTLGWNEAIALVQALPADTTPAEADRYMMTRAKQELAEMGPGNVIRLFAGKAWHFLRPYPLPDIHGTFKFWVMTLLESLLFLAGIAGAFFLRKKEKAAFWAALMIIGSGFAGHTLVHVYMRHRVPFLIPFLILFSAVLFQQFLAYLSARKEHHEVLESDPC